MIPAFGVNFYQTFTKINISIIQKQKLIFKNFPPLLISQYLSSSPTVMNKFGLTNFMSFMIILKMFPSAAAKQLNVECTSIRVSKSPSIEIFRY